MGTRARMRRGHACTLVLLMLAADGSPLAVVQGPSTGRGDGGATQQRAQVRLEGAGYAGLVWLPPSYHPPSKTQKACPREFEKTVPEF